MEETAYPVTSNTSEEVAVSMQNNPLYPSTQQPVSTNAENTKDLETTFYPQEPSQPLPSYQQQYPQPPMTTVILEPMPTSNKQSPPRPRTWLPFTVFVTLCCCVFFGVRAWRSGTQALYHHERKQYAAAKKASRQALKYNIAGVIGGILIWIVVLGSGIGYLVFEVGRLALVVSES